MRKKKKKSKMASQITLNGRAWGIYTVPKRPFVEIGKEPFTQFKLYVLHEVYNKDMVWIAQSIPALTAGFKAMTGAHIFSSSLYRNVRGTAGPTRKTGKKWICRKFLRTEIDFMQEYLQKTEILHVITKDADRWLFQGPDEL
jgi:hypothetical protein